MTDEGDPEDIRDFDAGDEQEADLVASEPATPMVPVDR